VACLIALLALIGPRVALVGVWLFTNLIDRAFTGLLLPILGVLLLPWTTLFYVAAYSPITGVTGFGWFIVILGFFFDLGSYSSGRRARA
jgi:hypothetical protein